MSSSQFLAPSTASRYVILIRTPPSTAISENIGRHGTVFERFLHKNVLLGALQTDHIIIIRNSETWKFSSQVYDFLYWFLCCCSAYCFIQSVPLGVSLSSTQLCDDRRDLTLLSEPNRMTGLQLFLHYLSYSLSLAHWVSRRWLSS